MAQLRHYYTLRWTSRSGVNCGGRRGLARPPFPFRPTVKPWLLLSLTHFTLPLCHTHTKKVSSDTLTARTPPSVVSIQQAETWHCESRRCRQLCNGRYVGHSFGQAVGGGGVGIIKGWRVVCGHLSSVSFFYPSPLVALHEGSHLSTASHLRLQESLWHIFYFELVRHPPTSSPTCRIKPCWAPLLTVFGFFSFPSPSYNFRHCYIVLWILSSFSLFLTWCCIMVLFDCLCSGICHVECFSCHTLHRYLAMLVFLYNFNLEFHWTSSLSVYQFVSSENWWFIYVINHGSRVNICTNSSLPNWSMSEQKLIPLFSIIEATPALLTW